MRVKAVRGAIQLEVDTKDTFERAVTQLIHDLLAENGITEDSVISIIFSQTGDLTAENPARALRHSGFSDTPLFCTQEPQYPGSLPRMLRVLLTFETDADGPVVPVYLGGARALRPDLYGT
jgi:chorismate mutase